jgi:hypothetical protein
MVIIVVYIVIELDPFFLECETPQELSYASSKRLTPTLHGLEMAGSN